MSDMRLAFLDFSSERETLGISVEAKITIIPITKVNSIRVKLFFTFPPFMPTSR
jgi:hypothetical protein